MSEPTNTPVGHSADDAFIQEIGPPFLTRFYGLLRAARLYSVSNQAVQRQLQEFVALLLRALEEETEISLVTPRATSTSTTCASRPRRRCSPSITR